MCTPNSGARENGYRCPRLRLSWLLTWLLCSVLWVEIVHAQSPPLIEAIKQYRVHGQQGRYAEAIPFAREALELVQKEFDSGHPNAAFVLNDLAFFYQSIRKYAEAEPLHRRALQIRENVLGPEHGDYVLDTS